jgi:hypothetical protein
MRRREFLAGLGVAAWPLTARAQHPAMPVIGFLGGGSPRNNVHLVAAFRQALAEVGYVEGQNAAIEFRWANGQFRLLPGLAADLVRRQVAVIIASGAPGAALAAKAATPTIPIVIVVGIDPVEYGLVASLNRPGGNVTGATSLSLELAGKRFNFVRDLLPQATTVAYLLGGPNLTSEALKSDILAAGRALGQQVVILETRGDRDDYEAGLRDACPTPGRSAHGRSLPGLRQQLRQDFDAGGAPPNSGDLSESRICRGGWPDELRRHLHRHLPSSRHLRRSDSQGRKARGPAGRAAD